MRHHGTILATVFSLGCYVQDVTAYYTRGSNAAAVEEETKSLEELHADALAEGGNLVIYHGGDHATQQQTMVDAFREAYPDINFTLIVDYSKYHNARVDNQLETNTLVPDIVALQTLQDYPRWKREGQLLHYKPAGFSAIYDGFTDKEDGAWLSHAVYTFSYFYDTDILESHGLEPPATARELADPKYTDLIASAYPHDDDASMFIFWNYVNDYGWDWARNLSKSNVDFNRGSHTPALIVGEKEKAIGVAGTAPWGIDTVTQIIGPDATSQYLAWGQRMAILAKARHPAAAKLFLNWVISKEVQTTVMGGFSSRTDIPPPEGSKHPWDIPQANSIAFQEFMEDRVRIEELKATFALYFGEVRGEPTPGQLGLHPGL